jgi:serine/threonine protein kinase/tetratricopeptide (TPR) repeat protein
VIGRTLAHYRIEEKIGAGGMGEVYRARDTKLDRDVALKVLPARFSADATRFERFLREAKTVAALNHPHIVTLHSIEEADGIHFLAMELVEGQALDQLIPGDGCPLSTILGVGIAVAEALAASHEKGIVHRDIKPANIMVAKDGRVKVLDFGLAKLASHTTSPDDVATGEMSLTGDGSFLGTIPYCSPEQLRGRKVDHRSDIFSLGIVLHELAAGQRPFLGETRSDVASSILRDTPAPLTRLRSDLPRPLEDLVSRCLEKRPDDRFQTTLDLLLELKELEHERAGSEDPSPRQGKGKPARNRLAVLPFENIGGDPEQDFFVEGMHEEVLASLGGISGLEVISRRSVRQYKNTTRKLQDIARDLRVDSLVEGSVRTSGNQVRITVELVDVSSDRHMWAHSYQKELRDVLTLQGEVAQAIAREVKAALTPEEEARLGPARAVDPESYHAYLKGRHHWDKRTPEAITRAGEFFQAAIDADPTYAKAHAGLADCYLMKGAAFYALQDPREAYPRARSAARKAIELDPMLAEPHASLGYLKTFFEWDWDGAESHFRRAIALNPGYAMAHLWSALRLGALSRLEEAIAAVDRALDLDPLSLIIIADKGLIYFGARMLEEAIRWSRKALELDERFAVGHWILGQAQEGLGRYDEAEASLTRAIALAEDNIVYHLSLARTIALSGRMEEAARRLSDRSATRPARSFLPSIPLAQAYVAMGETEKAIRALEKAHEQRENDMALMRRDWRFDPLRSDPRFQDLLRRMNFPA